MDNATSAIAAGLMARAAARDGTVKCQDELARHDAPLSDKVKPPGREGIIEPGEEAARRGFEVGADLRAGRRDRCRPGNRVACSSRGVRDPVARGLVGLGWEALDRVASFRRPVRAARVLCGCQPSSVLRVATSTPSDPPAGQSAAPPCCPPAATSCARVVLSGAAAVLRLRVGRFAHARLRCWGPSVDPWPCTETSPGERRGVTCMHARVAAEVQRKCRTERARSRTAGRALSRLRSGDVHEHGRCSASACAEGTSGHAIPIHEAAALPSLDPAEKL